MQATLCHLYMVGSRTCTFKRVARARLSCPWQLHACAAAAAVSSNGATQVISSAAWFLHSPNAEAGDLPLCKWAIRADMIEPTDPTRHHPDWAEDAPSRSRRDGCRNPHTAHEVQQRLSIEQEEDLVQWILGQDSNGFPPSHTRTREVITFFVRVTTIGHSVANGYQHLSGVIRALRQL